MDSSWSPGDHWLAGSLPGLLGTYPGKGPWIQDSWISVNPNRFSGLWDTVGGLFLRILSLLPTEQLAAGQGWLRNLSGTAKLSFTALRVWMGRISQGQARQAPAVRGMGGHPQNAPGSSHHTSCRAFLCFTGQCCKARSWRTMVLPLPSGHLLILDLLCCCPQPS